MPNQHTGPSNPHARFWSKVEKTDGCWLWHGTVLSIGYGVFDMRYDDGTYRKEYAHRLSYTWLVGPIPTGLHIDHLCRNKICIRPDHLEPVTMQVNVGRSPTRTPTVCPQGHAYAGSNLMWRGKHKRCRICVNAGNKRRRDARTPERAEHDRELVRAWHKRHSPSPTLR